MGYESHIWDEEKLSFHAKGVYCLLAKFADKTGKCWPGIDTLAKKSGLSKPTVRKALKELSNRNIISITKIKRWNQYTLNIPNDWTIIQVEPIIHKKYKQSNQWCSNKKRLMIYERDNYTCQYCGCSFSYWQLTLDHIMPRSRGGKNNIENLVTACNLCNAKKQARTPEEAGMPLMGGL